MKRILLALWLSIIGAVAAAPPSVTTEVDGSPRTLLGVEFPNGTLTTGSTGRLLYTPASGAPDWRVYRDASLYYALAKNSTTTISSNSISGLFQYIIDVAPGGAYSTAIEVGADFKSGGTRYPYTFTNSVIVTNAVIITGAGNSATVFAADASLNAPMFIAGALGTSYTGIYRFNKIRFEGSNGGANGVGVKNISAVELNFEHSEFYGWKKAGIELANTNVNMWGQADHCWFVVDNGGAGILISETPLEAGAYQRGEYRVENSLFGVGSGQGIKANKPFKNLSVSNSRMWWYSPFATTVQGISLTNAANAQIIGNYFQDWPANTTPIRFEDTASATNLNALVALNTASRGDGAASTPYVVYVGNNNQGVQLVGNDSLDGTGYLLGTGTTGSSLIVDKDGGVTTLGPISGSTLAGAGSNITALNASSLASGTVAPARLGTGSGGATKFLREDSTFQTITAPTPLKVYGAGTAYTLTATSALVAMGTTSPTLVLSAAGSYTLDGRVYVRYNVATYAASQTATFKLRRTNNTAADVSDSSSTMTLRILTTITDGVGVCTLPPVLYTTAASDDSISVFGVVSAIPSAGSVEVLEASIYATKL